MEPLTDRIAAIRQFNRFYTQRIGVLQNGFADSPFSLTQARVLYEILHREQPTASEIGAELGLDAGYLSRMLRDFARRGLVTKERSRVDGRQVHLTITPRGRKAFAPLEAHSQTEVATMLRSLSTEDQTRLVAAMQTVRKLLIGAPKGGGYVLRPHQPGDMGWIVSRHGTLYAEEQGWDHRLEAVAADIVATFLRRFDPERERCWIAERDGERLGCVMLVRETARVARLRLLLVEPSARGLGIGKRLVDECVAFARAAGYRKITLWTHTVLAAARRIYQDAGFRLVKTWRHDEFGKMLESESWALKL
jgi:DNA-binding MarR family transcriptional regulator/GNAT superfamily N-acetyltransferase